MSEKLLKYGAGGMVFLLPLFILSPPYALEFDFQVSGAKLVYALFLGSLCFSLYLAKKVHPAIGIIHAVISLSTAMTFSPAGGFYLYTLAYWMAGLGAALLFCETTESTQRFLLRALVLAGAASSILAFFQAMDMDPIMSYAANITPQDRVRPIALLGQTTKFGALLAMLIPVALALKDYPSFAVMFLALLLTRSSFSYAAAGAGMFIILRYHVGRAVSRGIAAAGALGAILFCFTDPASELLVSNGRYTVWETTLRAWVSEHFLFGFGPGSFSYVYAPVYQPKHLVYGSFIQAHNDYVQVAFEFGLFGVVGLALVLGFIAQRYYKDWWRVPPFAEVSPVLVAAQGGLAAILVNALGNFPFLLAPHYFLATIFLAILLLQPREKEF